MAGGHRPGSGRPKGAQNKHTKQFKELLVETYQALEDNEGKGEDEAKTGLLAFAKTNPTDFYRICSKLIPQQIEGEFKGEVKITVVRD